MVLLLSSQQNSSHVTSTFPASGHPGYDGVSKIKIGKGNAKVPDNVTFWELSTESSVKSKLDSDFDKRLPECFGVLRRRLENEREGEGTREYIRVLRLLEKHPLPSLRSAVEKGLGVNALTRDAIAQFLYPREDWSLTAFSLDGHPHLRHVRVAAPDLTQYRQLIGGVA